MKCKRHGAYKGINKPKGDCTSCWCVYIEKHFFEYKEVLTIDEMEHLVECLGCEVSIEELQNRLKISD